MRWNAEEAAVYFQSKEYIDTALIPVISLSFEDGKIGSGDENEWIQWISMEIERQFKGRILLLPPLTYVHTFEKGERNNWFKLWVESLNGQCFNHIVLIGTDDLRSVTETLDCEYFQVPRVPLLHVEKQYKVSMMEHEVKQLLPRIVELWQN
ncbi:DUF2487 family protein [Fervidibacillus albus]|uniref:YpiF family protein n=1 Tax=Fervidibacillus albus TaxID=2980026 RepID=A0A9E8LVQ0_9BACI|nr:DUF2487 family protein [Fervidibacillus albus]WAA10568.1 YpiF family protein [Fervidibacillus albus]